MTGDDDTLELRRAGPAERREALALLWRAARPDRAEVRAATLWLAVAGLLEAAGPLLGKEFRSVAAVLHGSFVAVLLHEITRYRNFFDEGGAL